MNGCGMGKERMLEGKRKGAGRGMKGCGNGDERMRDGALKGEGE